MASTAVRLLGNNPSVAARDTDQPAPCRTVPSHLYLPNPKTVTWERLESLRLQSLGLRHKYSRHFNVLRTSAGAQQDELGAMKFEDKLATQGMVPALRQSRQDTQGQVPGSALSMSNSMAPFSTVGKPTCGFFFSRETDNKKKKFGIPPSDLVKWRNFAAQHTGH